MNRGKRILTYPELVDHFEARFREEGAEHPQERAEKTARKVIEYRDKRR
jgi:hypothetical protein